MISPAIRSLFFLSIPILFVFLIPWWLTRYDVPALPFGEWSAIVGVVVFLLGLWLLGRTWYLFATRGKGTPAPFDPPRALVREGLYRYVRNPMFVGVFLILFGEALFWKSLIIFLYLAILAVIVQLGVRYYEEPNLERRFGEAYREYKRRVPRWLPRLRFTV